MSIDGGVRLTSPNSPVLLGTVSSRDRGHKIIEANGYWAYADNGEPYKKPGTRPCKRCGKPPTSEGYDACLGFLKGVQFACCGHGETEPVLIFKEQQ